MRSIRDASLSDGTDAGSTLPSDEVERPFSAMLVRLYMAGQSPYSAQALANLRTIVATAVIACTFEVVDVLADPRRAVNDGVLITPMLVRIAPSPPVRIIGTLKDRARVAQALGLDGPLGQSTW